MKKILIYVDSMNPSGGIERVIANLSNQWINHFNIVLLVKDNKNSFYSLDKRVKYCSLYCPLKINYSNRFLRGWGFLKSVIQSHHKLKKFLKKENPDFIYTSNIINSLEVLIQGSQYSKNLVISEHGSFYGYNSIYMKLKKYVYPRAYKITVPTTMDTEIYLKYGYSAVYIPHLSTFTDVSERSILKNKIVLNVGRLTSDKQQLKLIQIWKEILKKNDEFDWILQIVGKGEEESNLRNYVNKNSMNNNVQFIKPTENIAEYFKNASIFAFTSRNEGFGMVLLEAMSFGVPCISFDCPSGPRDLITNNENGFLIENNNVDEFVEKLQVLIKNYGLRKTMGEKAYEKAKNWDNDSIVQAWVDLFRGKL
ncbi:glycosyltransferase family 4 protein [Clostridium sp. P21]|uniref:Glycosyltransferase family 4 protein n=1 Tax=Clostridium muellerianum TaxID=2716538 RepID=A0A7Y0EKE0_9CLOT|nr:glycosyltransferase family 4 protein [Clostridium muellerianum]NMM65093.1 glycosyltransferase family 4 protein [Clostridium muellerianum]